MPVAVCMCLYVQALCLAVNLNHVTLNDTIIYAMLDSYVCFQEKFNKHGDISDYFNL